MSELGKPFLKKSDQKTKKTRKSMSKCPQSGIERTEKIMKKLILYTNNFKVQTKINTHKTKKLKFKSTKLNHWLST